MIPSLYNAGSASPANTQSVISPSRSEPNVNCSSSSLSSFFFPPSLDPVSVPFEQAERTNINTKDKMIILNFFFKTFSPLYFVLNYIQFYLPLSITPFKIEHVVTNAYVHVVLLRNNYLS